jgi:hypothetical protein
MGPSRQSLITATALISGAVLWLALAVPPVSAEWFADLYLGGAFTDKSDVKDDSPTGATTLKHIRFNRSSGYGLRIGYWFDFASYVGVSLDVSHFRPDTVPSSLKRLDLYMTPMAFDLMLRWPLLPTDAIPRGRLQPYLTVGPAIALAEAKDTTNLMPTDQYETDFPLGVQVAAGLVWQFYPHVALFAEYRYTHFSPEFRFRTPPGSTRLRFDLDTRYPLAGISVRF